MQATIVSVSSNSITDWNLYQLLDHAAQALLQYKKQMVCRLLSLIPLFIIHRQHAITSCELCQCSHKFWYSAESKTTVSGFTESHSQEYQLENDGHHHIPFEKC